MTQNAYGRTDLQFIAFRVPRVPNSLIFGRGKQTLLTKIMHVLWTAVYMKINFQLLPFQAHKCINVVLGLIELL